MYLLDLSWVCVRCLGLPSRWGRGCASGDDVDGAPEVAGKLSEASNQVEFESVLPKFIKILAN